MDTNEDPGANTEMFRVYVESGERERARDGTPVGRVVLVVAVIAVLVVGLLLLV